MSAQQLKGLKSDKISQKINDLNFQNYQKRYVKEKNPSIVSGGINYYENNVINYNSSSLREKKTRGTQTDDKTKYIIEQ